MPPLTLLPSITPLLWPPTDEASLPLSCWKQEALLSGSRGCLRTPLLGLGLSYSLSGSMACSLSMAGSECGGRDCGNPNIKREEKKSKAPQSRKPPHQAPIQRGSSGVMSRLPAIREGGISRRGGGGAGIWLSLFCQGHGWAEGSAKGLGQRGLDTGQSSPSSTPVLLFLPKPKTDRSPSLIFLSTLSLYQSKYKLREARHPLSLD